MWQNWINIILGFWLILIAFLGFSSTLNSIILTLTGLAIIFFSFRLAGFINLHRKRPESEIMPERPNQNNQSASSGNHGENIQ